MLCARRTAPRATAVELMMSSVSISTRFGHRGSRDIRYTRFQELDGFTVEVPFLVNDFCEIALQRRGISEAAYENDFLCSTLAQALRYINNWWKQRFAVFRKTHVYCLDGTYLHRRLSFFGHAELLFQQFSRTLQRVPKKHPHLFALGCQ